MVGLKEMTMSMSSLAMMALGFFVGWLWERRTGWSTLLASAVTGGVVLAVVKAAERGVL